MVKMIAVGRKERRGGENGKDNKVKTLVHPTQINK